MDFFEHFLCRDQLFDLICYEIRAGRVGKETMQIFDDHLVQCSLCRRQAIDFFQMLDVTDAGWLRIEDKGHCQIETKANQQN